MSTKKLHTNTRCRVMNRADLKFEFFFNESVNTARCFFPDTTAIQPNYYHFWSLIRLDLPFRYFLMDHREHVKSRMLYSRDCKNEQERFEKAQVYLKSMTEFSKHFKKNLYLRLLPPVTIGTGKESRILVDEMLEMIPIALKQQKTPIEADDGRLMELRQMYPETERSYTTITIEDLEMYLNEFDINKSLITIVPDPAYEMMRAMNMQRSEPLKIPGPAMKFVISTYQAVNFMFDTMVVGIDWSKDLCTNHVDCNANTKKFIMHWMHNVGALSDIVYTDPEMLYRLIHRPEVRCALARKTEKGVLDVFTPSPEKETFITKYQNVAKQFNIQKYPLFVAGSRRDYMPDWEIKFLGKLGWLQQFFGEKEHPAEKYILVECLYFHPPLKHVAAAREFVNNIIPPQKPPIQKEPSTSEKEPSTSEQAPSPPKEGSSTESDDDGSAEDKLAAGVKNMNVQHKRSGKHKKKKGKKGKKGKK